MMYIEPKVSWELNRATPDSLLNDAVNESESTILREVSNPFIAAEVIQKMGLFKAMQKVKDQYLIFNSQLPMYHMRAHQK